MTTHFSGSELSTNELRAELIGLSNSGDKSASGLLKVLTKHSEPTAGEIVHYYLQRSGTSSLETSLAGIGLVCFGLMFGILALTFNSIVPTDSETLLILFAAFVTGQCCLTAYNKIHTARLYAQEFQKLATSIKINTLMKQHYNPVGHGPGKGFHSAYGSVA